MDKSNEVSIQLHEIMQDVGKGAEEALRKAISETSKEAVQKLKNSSPKRPGGGEYAAGWSVKKDGKTDAIVHNKVYRLTHLLENGHVSRNQYGTYGRVPAYPHIKPVEEWASEELPRRVMENLNDNL